MIGVFGVTFKTRKPIAAAFEFDGDNVKIFVIMVATGLVINIRAFYFYIVNQHK
jgi:hypothetical protein